ncbi:MAG: ABC transporter permease [Treponema sp.]|nr:ABC transporter permease [Treponema sp.]
MTAAASFLFAARMLFPKTEKKSAARRSLFGAMICIAISLVPLIVVLSVSDGMIQGMTERIIGLSSSHLTLRIDGMSVTREQLPAMNALVETIAAVPGVTNAYPEISLTALAAGKSYRTGAHVRAVPAALFQNESTFRSFFSCTEGDYTDFTDGSRTALIGTYMADVLGIGAGDTFRLLSLSRTVSGSFTVRTVLLTVAAVVSSGYQELDALWVFIPVETAFQSLPVSAADVFVRVETADAFSAELARIEQDIDSRVADYARVYSWQELNSTQFENFSSTKVMLVFIMALIVLVASVNISAALVMLVMERQREIAIIKSIGGTTRGVVGAFLCTGCAVASGGILLGVPVGLLCAVNSNKIINFTEKILNIGAELWYLLNDTARAVPHITLMDPMYYLTEIPIVIPFGSLCGIVALTLVLSVVVSVVPAYRAGRERPLETVRRV